MHNVGRNPGYSTDQDIVSAGAPGNQCGQPFGREIDVALQGDDGLQLEEVSSPERTQRYLMRSSIVEPVPSIPIQPFHEDVGDHCSNVQAFAGKANAHCAADQTSATVCAHQITGPER